MIVEPGDPVIRPELLQEFEQKIEDERRHDTSRKVYIVQFYDTRRTWYVHCATSRHSLVLIVSFVNIGEL